jgi:hypothetical protein
LEILLISRKNVNISRASGESVKMDEAIKPWFNNGEKKEIIMY